MLDTAKFVIRTEFLNIEIKLPPLSVILKFWKKEEGLRLIGFFTP